MVRDVILDDAGGMQIIDGDFVIDSSTAQHERLLIVSNKGEWRQHPTCGVGIERYINDEAPGDLPTAIRTELKNDGMTVKTVRMNMNGQIEIDAEYN